MGVQISPSALSNFFILNLFFIVGGSAVSIAVLLFSVYFMVAVFLGAPFLPTGKKYVEKMLDCVALKSGETFVDLGAGDGRMVIAAARRGARAIGYEINPFLVAFGRLRIRLAGVGDRAEMRLQSLWSADLRTTDVVALFAITNMMPRLEKKFLDELRPGSRVVSYIFSLPNWKPLLHTDGIRVYER